MQQLFALIVHFDMIPRRRSLDEAPSTKAPERHVAGRGRGIGVSAYHRLEAARPQVVDFAEGVLAAAIGAGAVPGFAGAAAVVDAERVAVSVRFMGFGLGRQS